nr:hypothetical protein [Elstera litoralis]
MLADRLKNALTAFCSAHPEGRHVVIAGGVAANKALRVRLQSVVAERGLTLVAPPLKLCTDNAQ